MKRLKMFLMLFFISLFSFIFPFSVNADTFKNVEWKYTDDALKFPIENATLLNNLYEYISGRTFYLYNSSYKVDKYAVVWDFHHLSENYIVGVFLNSSTINTYYVNSPSNKDYNMYSANQSNKINISSSTITIKFNFNENKLITGYEATELSYNNVSVSSWSMFFSSNALYNDTYISYLDLYVDTHFIQNSDAFGYVKISSWFEDANLKLKIGDKIFNTDELVPIKTFFDYLQPSDLDISCDTQPLGSVKNVSSFTFEVTGVSNALKSPLKGEFWFVGSGAPTLFSNDYNITFKEKNNNEVTGKYTFFCNDDDIGSGCSLKYEYKYIDDIDTLLTLQFTFTPKSGKLSYQYHFHSCNLNNSKMNYTYNNNPVDNNQIVDNPSIENILTDNSPPDLNGLSNASTWLPQGPVDSIIMLPLNFINTLVSKIGSTCSPVNLPLPFMKDKFLPLPCVNTLFDQINGFSTLYDLIGVIGSVYLLYNYLLKFYKWIDDTLSFRENNWQDWGGD